MSITKRLFSKDKKALDMTEGPIIPLLLSFAFPYFLGNLFQIFYNTVDAWVVGNFVSNEAFSAVGTVSPVITLVVGFFNGFAGGTGIVISQMFGARRHGDVEKTVHTAFTITLLSSIFIAALGILLSPVLLRMMNTPDSVFADASVYLTVYFVGIAGSMIYNIGAGILRATGDSRRPFIFLVISALINIVLDLIFVLCFNMGVFGVSLATVIANAVSAVLVILVLLREKGCIRLNLRNLRIDGTVLKKVLSVGLPTAVQVSLTSLGGVVVKSYINAFGEDFMSGVTVYSKIESFVLIPASSISVASSTFVGQNLGARNTPRAKRGILMSFLLAATSLTIMLIPTLLFTPEIASFFNKKPEVIEYGTEIIRLLAPLFFFANYNTIIAGAMRGAGKSLHSTVIVLITYVGFRMLYLFVMANYISNTPLAIIFSYAVSWLLCAIIITVWFFRMKFESTLI